MDKNEEEARDFFKKYDSSIIEDSIVC
ncbi:uncharacterized protein METZ01_LOCUS369365, partial [marine metagenome]